MQQRHSCSVAAGAGLLMDTRCYKLVNSTTDKVVAFSKAIAAEVLALGLLWSALVYFSHPVTLTLCSLSMLVGPLVLIDVLTTRVCITDHGMSIVSVVKRLGDPWISWEQLTRVNIQLSPMHTSAIKKVAVHGRYEVHGLGGTYWQPRMITIPGHHPDIQRIIQDLREVVPDKFS